MGEKKEVKVTVASLFLALELIIIVVMGVVICKLYSVNTTMSKTMEELNLSLNEKVADEEETSNEMVSEISNEIEKDSELVKELYNIVLKYNNYNDIGNLNNESTENIKFSFYRDNKLNYNDLTDIEKVLSFMNSIKDEDYAENVNIENSNLSLYKNEYKNYNINDEQTKTANVYSNVNENIKRIFGKNAKIENKNYSVLAGIVEYYDDSYYMYSIEGGGLGNTKYGYSEIQKVEQNGEEIYIYDKYIYLDFTNALVATDDELVHVYTSTDKTNEIGKEKNNFTYDQEKGEYELQDVFEKYEDKLNTYKHTFQKAEDGTYYWVSSEIYE